MNFAFRRKPISPSWRPSDGRARLGRWGERVAARYLRRRGYRLLARNYRNHAGEIDLIAAEGPVLVCVEVKSRLLAEGEPMVEQVVTSDQWSRIEGAARILLTHSNAADRPCRFDVIRVFRRRFRRTEIEHVEAAYYPRAG